LDAPLLNVLVALGVGLLIGVERERTNLETGADAAAGLRTFSIAALIGAAAALVDRSTLVPIVVAGVGLMAALSYWATLRDQGPGLTTELALLLTVLAGALAVAAPAAAAALGALTALLLGGRRRMHHFVGTVLTEEEIRSALVLAAAVIVVLPVLPNEPMGPFGALNPYKVWRLVVLVLLIGSAGHVATRLLGPRYGLPISGLASGFISSSATIGAMGARAAKAPEILGAAAAGAVLSTVATVVQMAAVVGATSEPALESLTPALIPAGLVAAAYGALFMVRALRQPAPESEPPGSPFSLSAALVFAATLSAVMLASAALREWFGEAGAIAAAAVAGFVDTHASAISIAAMVASGRLEPDAAVIPILAGFTTNSITKVVLASTAGGRGFAIRVVPGVVLVGIAAWAGAVASGLWR
jgi:uncharacterized membrane protein (DUF4010 family)